MNSISPVKSAATPAHQQLEALLRAAFTPHTLVIDDDSDAHAGHAGARHGGHFNVHLVSDAFRGHALLARHRMVYAALGDLSALGVHALSLRTEIPEEIR